MDRKIVSQPAEYERAMANLILDMSAGHAPMDCRLSDSI